MPAPPREQIIDTSAGMAAMPVADTGDRRRHAGRGIAAPRRRPKARLPRACVTELGFALDGLPLRRADDPPPLQLIGMLAEALEERSIETAQHARRVGAYARRLGALCGLAEDELRCLELAAPLHDAGKIAIPDDVLHKPDLHTPQERAIMESHTTLGARMFSRHDLPEFHAAGIIAAQHHERWDGAGYPLRLRGEGIHLYARITSVVDVFDALGNRRCYKPAWALPDVVEFMRLEARRKFDPFLVDLMLTHLDGFLEIDRGMTDASPRPGTA